MLYDEFFLSAVKGCSAVLRLLKAGSVRKILLSAILQCWGGCVPVPGTNGVSEPVVI